MEATRTLVKSPPELWAEVSDVATLARHLGKFGEIRITRTEPESVVEWEGDRASGTVRLEPAGWGTRVTLTVEPLDPGDAPSPHGAADVGTGDDAPVDTVAVARGDASLMEVPRVDQPADATGLADDTPTEGVPAEDPVPVAVEAGESVPAVDGGSLETSSPAAEVEPAQIEPSAGPDETADEPARESRRGFFARVFGRWRRRRAAAEAVAAAPAETPEPTVRETPSAAPEETSEPRQLGTPSAPPEESPEQTALETPSVPEAPLDPPQAPPLPPTEAPPVDPPDVPTVDPPQAPPMPPPEAPPLDPQAPPTQSADDAPEQSIAGVDGAAILGQALDALGAHHHRPFSR